MIRGLVWWKLGGPDHYLFAVVCDNLFLYLYLLHEIISDESKASGIMQCMANTLWFPEENILEYTKKAQNEH